MGHPRIGTVRHVVVNQPSNDEFYWVTWEQFRIDTEPKWTVEAKKFETYKKASEFSLSL
jgi:hypothetical protein